MELLAELFLLMEAFFLFLFFLISLSSSARRQPTVQQRRVCIFKIAPLLINSLSRPCRPSANTCRLLTEAVELRTCSVR